MSGRSRQHAEVAMTVDALRRHQAARRSVSSSGVRRSGAFLLGPGFGALVEQALGIARRVQSEWRAGAVTQQPPAPRAVSGLGVVKLLTKAAFATPRRNWWRVTNDNGLRADVILALDRLTHRYSPALRAEAGAAPASYAIPCTNLAEEDRQT